MLTLDFDAGRLWATQAATRPLAYLDLSVPVVAGVFSTLWTGGRFPLVKVLGAVVVLAGARAHADLVEAAEGAGAEALANPPEA